MRIFLWNKQSSSHVLEKRCHIITKSEIFEDFDYWSLNFFNYRKNVGFDEIKGINAGANVGFITLDLVRQPHI